MRSILSCLVLFAMWLLMSGMTKPMIVWLGFGASVVAIYVVRRMDDAADAKRLAIRLRPFELVKYTVWLLVEIAKSNWAVTKVILSPKMPMRQNLFEVPFSQSTDLGQTIFANSITLTPGTISVEVDHDHFLVHALQYCDDDIDAIADMDARVTKIEAAH